MCIRDRFTGLPGKYVKLEDSIRSFAAILDGECDEIPEQCFRMKGSIEDVYACLLYTSTICESSA